MKPLNVICLILGLLLCFDALSQTETKDDVVFQFNTTNRHIDDSLSVANIESIVVTENATGKHKYSLKINKYNDDALSYRINDRQYNGNIDKEVWTFDSEFSLEIVLSNMESKLITIFTIPFDSQRTDDSVIPSCLLTLNLYTQIKSNSNCDNGGFYFSATIPNPECNVSQHPELKYSIKNYANDLEYGPKKFTEGFSCVKPMRYILEIWGYDDGVYESLLGVSGVDLNLNSDLVVPNFNGPTSKSCLSSSATVSINSDNIFLWSINGSFIGATTSFTFDENYPPGDYQIEITAACCPELNRTMTFIVLSDCCSGPPTTSIQPNTQTNSFNTIGYNLCGNNVIDIEVTETQNAPFTSLGWNFTNHPGNNYSTNLDPGSYTQEINQPGEYSYTVVNFCGFDQNTFYVYDCCGAPGLSNPNQTIEFCDLDAPTFDLSIPISGSHDYLDVSWTFVDELGASSTLTTKALTITRSELGQYQYTINNGCGSNSGAFTVIAPPSGCNDYTVSDCSISDLLDIDIVNGGQIELSLNDFRTNSLDIKLSDLEITTQELNNLLANVESIRLEYNATTGIEKIPLNIADIQSNPYGWVDMRALSLVDLSSTTADVFIKNAGAAEEFCTQVEFRSNEDLTLTREIFGCENQISLVEVSIDGGEFPIDLIVKPTGDSSPNVRSIRITNESQRLQQFPITGIDGLIFTASDINGGGLEAFCFFINTNFAGSNIIYHHIESENPVSVTISHVLSLITCTDFGAEACIYWIKNEISDYNESIIYTSNDALKLVVVIDGIIVAEVILSDDADGDTLIGESCTADNDNDMIPDCEDKDHDNDMVLNIDEDLNGNRDLYDDDANNNGIPAFLDPLETEARSDKCSNVEILDIFVGTPDCFTREVPIEILAIGEDLEYSIDGENYFSTNSFILILDQSYDIRIRNQEYNCEDVRYEFVVDRGACTAEICTNDEDNDGDGFPSCEDLDCILLVFASDSNLSESYKKSTGCNFTCALEDPSAGLYDQMVDHADAKYNTGPIKVLIDQLIKIKNWFDKCSEEGFEAYEGKGIIPKCFWINAPANPTNGIGDIALLCGMVDGAYLEISELIKLAGDIATESPRIILKLSILQFQLYSALISDCSDEYQCLRASTINEILIATGNETLSIEEFKEQVTLRNIVFEEDYRQFFETNSLSEGCELLASLKLFANTLLEFQADWKSIKQAFLESKDVIKMHFSGVIDEYIDDITGADVGDRNIAWYRSGKFTIFVGSFFTGIGAVTKITKVKALLKLFKNVTNTKWTNFKTILKEFLGIADDLAEIRALLLREHSILRTGNKVEVLINDFKSADLSVLKSFIYNPGRVNAWNSLVIRNVPNALRTNVKFLTRLKVNPKLVNFVDNLTDVGKLDLANNAEEWIKLYDARALLRNGDINGVVQILGGRLKPTTSLGFIRSGGTAADNAYITIANSPEQVNVIARNLAEVISGSINPPASLINKMTEVVGEARNHFFVDSHLVEDAAGVFVEGKFVPRLDIADQWNAVANTAFDMDDAEGLIRFLQHEYVESKLLSDGIVFSRINPGNSGPTSYRYGAHDLAPFDNPAELNIFEHWTSMNRSFSPTQIANDFSNIDDVVTEIRIIEGIQ